MITTGQALTPQERRDRASALMAQRAEKISEPLKRVSLEVPPAYRSLFLKSLTGEVSPRQAIRAMCQRCNAYEDVINRTRTCSVIGCPLRPHRPYQDGDSK
jgi:hypothetical protein